MREPGSFERPWSASISSAIYKMIKGQISINNDHAVPAGQGMLPCSRPASEPRSRPGLSSTL